MFVGTHLLRGKGQRRRVAVGVSLKRRDSKYWAGDSSPAGGCKGYENQSKPVQTQLQKRRGFMNLDPIVKIVRAYDSTEWEVFISEWQKGLQGYVAVKRLGGTGDHGLDVIGLCGPMALQGAWDNFQCKHYETPLSTPKA